MKIYFDLWMREWGVLLEIIWLQSHINIKLMLILCLQRFPNNDIGFKYLIHLYTTIYAGQVTLLSAYLHNILGDYPMLAQALNVGRRHRPRASITLSWLRTSCWFYYMLCQPVIEPKCVGVSYIGPMSSHCLRI